MNKLRILIAIILVVSFSNCKRNDRKIITNILETKEISLLDTLTLKLNKGEKWIVNNETQVGVNKMDSIISAFKKEENKDYLKLGKDLSVQTGYIIRSCNMTGEAHDQLHVVLVPMLDEISTLKESENKKESKLALSELETLIAAYFNHFEI
jgi:hypothetical protein